jgi:hypothetical protein
MAMTMAYADRKNTLTKKQIASFSKWAVARPKADEATISQKQRDLWTALNQFVTEHGGFVTSVQFAQPIRIEVPIGSALPAKLAAAGYDLVFNSQTTRLGAAPVQHDRRGRARPVTGYSFHTVDVFELRLPK